MMPLSLKMKTTLKNMSPEILQIVVLCASTIRITLSNYDLHWR